MSRSTIARHVDDGKLARIAGLALVLWFILLCVVPDPRPLGAPEWSVRFVRNVAGVSEPAARFAATLLLRGVGVGLIGILLALSLSLSHWRMRHALPMVLVGAPVIAVVAKRLNFGSMPIWPQLVFIVVVAVLGGLAGLALRRNWMALASTAILAFGLSIWGASTGVPDDLHDAWRETALHVLEEAKEVPEGDEGFLRLLQIAFAYAEDNSHGTDAVLPNRAAILALGKILGEDKVARVGGREIDLGESEKRNALRQRMLLSGRNDLPRHFWVSAALTVLSDAPRARTVGLSKELMDSTAGGSGFSFVDMAANNAGIRLAVVATRNSNSAHELQARIRQGVERDDLFPAIDGLPEKISRDDLQSDFGGIGGAETQRLLNEIDRRIAVLRLYQ
jgi:hypothetical protein